MKILTKSEVRAYRRNMNESGKALIVQKWLQSKPYQYLMVADTMEVLGRVSSKVFKWYTLEPLEHKQDAINCRHYRFA